MATVATWIVDVLRNAGVTVKTMNGWEGRTHGTFNPVAVVWHHDASREGDSPGVPGSMLARWDTAGAQLWVDRYGVWTVLAAGKAFHAGKVLPGMPSNSNAWGIETDHTTGEAWPEAQLASLRVGTAAILRRMGRDGDDLHFHRTICSPVGRKVDPDGLNLTWERAHVLGAALSGAVTPASAPAPTQAPAPTGPRSIGLGDTGDDVRQLQQQLADLGYDVGAIDGVAGSRTTAAIAALQRAGGVTVDSIAGPQVRGLLAKGIRAPAPSAPAVTGPNLSVDGDFGPATKRAAQAALGVVVDADWGDKSRRALQARVGAKVDGDVGPATVKALQRYLNARGEHLVVDGDLGPATVRGLQRVLNKGAF